MSRTCEKVPNPHSNFPPFADRKDKMLNISLDGAADHLLTTSIWRLRSLLTQSSLVLVQRANTSLS